MAADIYPSNAVPARLAGALLLEYDADWLVGRRYLWLESLEPELSAQPDR